MLNDRPRVLSGIRVLDFGRVVAAPHAARSLSDLGADVIKIERPERGDDLRMDPYIYPSGHSAAFMQQNWGKRSLALNLRDERSLPIVRRLVECSDVLIENFRPGVMDEIGIGYEDLAEVNPRLVMCSISAYGQESPYAQRGGYGPIVEAAAGVPDLTGEPDGPPMPTVVAIADHMAAALASTAICAALYGREQSGRGEHIDIALFDATFQMHDFAVQLYLASEGATQISRRGLFDDTLVPWGFFKAGGSWIIVMAGNEATWQRLAKALGREDWLGPDYAGWDARRPLREAIYRDIAAWAESLPSAEAALEILVEAGVPCERVNTIPEAIGHPQVEARNLLVGMDHPEVGPVRVMNSGIKLKHASADVHGLPPDVGEHTSDILGDLLKYDQSEIAQMLEDGLVFSAQAASATGR